MCLWHNCFTLQTKTHPQISRKLLVSELAEAEAEAAKPRVCSRVGGMGYTVVKGIVGMPCCMS